VSVSAALLRARARAGRVARATAFLPGLVAALLGAANLLRWPLGDAWAQGWARGDPCTGAGLVLTGAALTAQAVRRPRLVAAFGVGAGLFVALSIALLGLGARAPGLLHRPAPPATVGLLLTLIAVALVHEGGGARRLVQGLLGVIVAQLALVALVGFGYDPEVGGAVSAGLALLGAGLLTASWARQAGEPLGRMHARRFALVTASATTLGFCVVWQLLLDRERERTDAGIEALAADTTILPEVSLLLGLGLSSALAGLVDLMVRERHRGREVHAAAQRLAREAAHRLEAEALLAEQARRLERYAAALARSNQDLEAFAYVAAHDLRSPLRAIRSLSTWIEEDLKEHLVGESKENLALLRARVKRMEDLLQSLLDYSRAGRATGDVADVDVASMAREAWDLLGAPEGFRLELAPDLPRFRAARAPFEQVVRNLLSNATKHHDRPTGVVSLSADGPRDGAFAFTVTDDGPGIPPEYHEQVFGMFKTLKPRDKVEGSGMGLALVKRLVERHGGTVRIASPTRADAGGGGRGTTLRFTWPATPRPEEAA
jgi:signal transduction histidine kinase